MHDSDCDGESTRPVTRYGGADVEARRCGTYVGVRAHVRRLVREEWLGNGGSAIRVS
ncbi:hypothetical protein V6Z11_D07G136700 [Gossypium hirsutum]